MGTRLLLPVKTRLIYLVLWVLPLPGIAHQPNILLLVAEDLSPRIGAWGDNLAHTPNLDALASVSTKFTNVFTTAGVCAPSRAALITGQYQFTFAAQHMRTSTGPLGPYLALPPPELRAFPELLRKAGYYTYTDTKLDYQFSGIRAGSGPFTLWDADGAAPTAWRNAKPGQPFFGLVNFIATHESGVMRPTGPAHSEAHRNTQIFRKRGNVVAESITNPKDVDLPPYYPDLPSVRADMARHYDNIALMDRQVGEILNALAQDGQLENTIVIWTSDHGDGLPRAKRELYDSGLHVPFLLSLPSDLRHLSDLTENNRLVSFVDLAPTILELAGVEVPSHFHGKSIFGEEREFVFAGRDRIDEVMDRQRAIRDNRFKYIRSWYPEVPGGHPLEYRDNLDMTRAMREAWRAGQLTPDQKRWFEPVGQHQLYDTRSDPHEINNLADDPRHRATLARLRKSLLGFLDVVGDTSVQPENELRSSLLRDEEIPSTPAVEYTVDGDFLTLTNPIGASIGYRTPDSDHWLLYQRPLAVEPGMAVEAKSVRYGWRESPVVLINLK